MENHQRNAEKKLWHNVRVRKETFDIIGAYCYSCDKSLARAIEEALEDYIEKHDLESRA